MQAHGLSHPRSFARAPAEHTAIAGRLRQTRLFNDYRTAFVGFTGLSVEIVDSPPRASSARPGPGESRGSDLNAGPRQCEAITSCVPIRLGDTIAAWLQLGPFLWCPEGDQADGQQRRGQCPGRSLNRREHRSILRLLGVFAHQLAGEAEGLMLAQRRHETPFVEAARVYIAAHLTNDLALTKVAAAVNVSVYYFCKRFRESTGLHFTDYVNRSRVALVKERLLNPHVRVSEAAFEAGFQSLSQFNRAFRRVVGEAPSAFRHRLHPQLSVARHRSSVNV